MPLTPDPCLVGNQRPLTKLPLAERVQLQLGEKLGECGDGLVGPLVLRHKWNKGVLSHGHLTKAKPGIHNDILGCLEG